MHIQLPLGFDSEKTMLIADIIRLLPDFDAEFLAVVRDRMEVSPLRQSSPRLRLCWSDEGPAHRIS